MLVGRLEEHLHRASTVRVRRCVGEPGGRHEDEIGVVELVVLDRLGVADDPQHVSLTGGPTHAAGGPAARGGRRRPGPPGRRPGRRSGRRTSWPSRRRPSARPSARCQSPHRFATFGRRGRDGDREPRRVRANRSHRSERGPDRIGRRRPPRAAVRVDRGHAGPAPEATGRWSTTTALGTTTIRPPWPQPRAELDRRHVEVVAPGGRPPDAS